MKAIESNFIFTYIAKLMEKFKLGCPLSLFMSLKERKKNERKSKIERSSGKSRERKKKTKKNTKKKKLKKQSCPFSPDRNLSAVNFKHCFLSR